MARRTRIRSHSSAETSDNAFARCLATIILALNKNNAPDCYRLFPAWATAANPFMRKHGILKALGPMFNRICQKKKDNAPGMGAGLLTEDDARHIVQTLRAKKLSIHGDMEVSREIYDFIYRCQSNLSSCSIPSFNRIIKSISVLRSPELSQIWAEDLDEDLEVDGLTAKAVAAKLKVLVGKITGDASAAMIHPKKLQELRPTANPKFLAEYSRYAAVVNKTIKHEVFRLCNTSGKTMIPMSDLTAALDRKRIPHILAGGQYGIQVDDQLRPYTREGRPLDRLPQGTIRPNPKYDPDKDNTYAFEGVDHFFRYRTLTFTANNRAKRFSRVGAFLEKESEHRNKWLTDLMKKSTDEQVLAAVVELMASTAARIGGKGNATKGEPTYGLTTLQGKHVSISGNKIIFDYAGKKNASQYAVYDAKDIVSKKVLEVVRALKAKAKPDSHLFVSTKGRPITAPHIRTYIRELGIDLSPHDFRRLKGTKIAKKVFAACPFKKGAKQAEVDRWFKKELEEVGEALHHTSGGDKIVSSTAIKSYIDPSVMRNFYLDLGLRPLKAIPATA